MLTAVTAMFRSAVEHASCPSRPSCRSRRRTLCAVLGILALAATVSAQRIWVGEGRFWRTPPKWATHANFDGSFNYCRGYYTSSRREAGGSGWDTDYPGSDNNFSVRLAELTLVRVKLDVTGQPDYVVVRLTDPLLFRCPMLYMEDVGTVQFSDAEVESLRAYLLKGGFLTVDDFWGTFEWSEFAAQMRKIFPYREIKDIPRDHPLFHVMYDTDHIIQTPSLAYVFNGGITWEVDGFEAECKGIWDDSGRLMVVINHNTDLGDAYEWSDDPRYPNKFSGYAFRVAVNFIMYALSH